MFRSIHSCQTSHTHAQRGVASTSPGHTTGGSNDAKSIAGGPVTSARRSLLRIALAFGVLALGSLAMLAPSTATAQQGQQGYVDTTALNLRADAGTKSAIVGIMLKYDTVTVLGRKKVGGSTWYEIEASGGYTNGFVSARYVQFGSVPEGARETEPLDYGAKETPTLMRGDFMYVGPRACAECHTDSTGEFPDGASTVWSHTVHSSAYKTLSKDYTIEIAKRKRDIDDPINDWRCVKCHVTAFGAEPSQLGPNYSHNDGVSCEVCHGPGGSYADEDHGPSNLNREALGFRILTDLTERREVCTSCHNAASPTYKPFNLREFSRSIAHWVDPGDQSYYKDAISEATRRQTRVESNRAERALALAATASTEADEAADAKAAADAANKEAKRAKERTEREAASAKANADERARLDKEQANADAAAEAEAQAEAAAAAAAKADRAENARAAAQKKLAAEERAARDAERKAAEAALASEAAAAAGKERTAAAARKKFEEQARQKASTATGVESFLEDVDDVISLNTNGDKYLAVDFPHLAHASKQYLPDGNCSDCHHTQEGDDAPEACSTCHDIGGDADEEKKKTRSVHSKNQGFPRTGDQEQTSCVGCHKSMNALLEAGKRDGEAAPTKCTACHKRKN
ncbi:MAG: hypothetical protein ACI8W3_002133 [Myxococcota bacterium]|jgi:hypothetical protein